MSSQNSGLAGDERVASAIRAAYEYIKKSAPDGDESAKLALESIEPVAIALNPELAEELSTLEELHMTKDSAELRWRIPHWAMRAFAMSFAESMADASNYRTMTAELGEPGGPRFEIILRQIGKGQTAHELRVEAETKLSDARSSISLAFDVLNRSVEDWCSADDGRNSRVLKRLMEATSILRPWKDG